MQHQNGSYEYVAAVLIRPLFALCGHFDKPIKRQLSALTGQFEFLYLGNKNPAKAW
jgi:hypothetical protein